MNTLEKLSQIYESAPVICNSSNQVRDFLRARRGRDSERLNELDTHAETVSIKSGIHLSTIRRAEVDPYQVSVRTLRNLARSHGKELVIIFYDKDAS